MGMKLFNFEGDILVQPVQEGNVIDHIPPAVYKLRITKQGLLMTKDRDSFTVPEKCYGRHAFNKKRILEAYRTNPGSTGAILEGLKGSGKSLLAEDVCNNLLKQDVPVFMIDDEIPEAMLRMTIALAGPCVLYFDEFGKVYKEKKRTELLTLFSDSGFKKVMFLVTNNEQGELNEYMINRPGRFRFHISYSDLDVQAAAELLDDYGIHGEMRVLIQAYIQMNAITFDMLRFIVPIAAASASLTEFRDEVAILNCPSVPMRGYEIADVQFDGEPFVGWVELKWDHGTFTLALTPHTATEALSPVTFAYTAGQVLEENVANQLVRFVPVEGLIVDMRVVWKKLVVDRNTDKGTSKTRLITKALEAEEKEAEKETAKDEASSKKEDSKRTKDAYLFGGLSIPSMNLLAERMMRSGEETDTTVVR